MCRPVSSYERQINPRPERAGYPPPDGDEGGEGRDPFLSLLREVVAGSGKAFEITVEIITNVFPLFFSTVNINVASGHLSSHLAKYHISLEMSHYPKL